MFTGGLSGITKEKKAELESMLEFIEDDSYYESFTDKLTRLVFSIAKVGHYFADGNKRSSIAIGSYFMIVNGFGSLVGVFIPSMENVVLCVADNILSKDQLHEIINEILINGEMSEGSQLLILNSMEEYQRREDERRCASAYPV